MRNCIDQKKRSANSGRLVEVLVKMRCGNTVKMNDWCIFSCDREKGHYSKMSLHRNSVVGIEWEDTFGSDVVV